MVLSISIQVQKSIFSYCSSYQILHLIIFILTLKEDKVPRSFAICLVYLPRLCYSVIYLLACKCMKVGKAQIICKACVRKVSHLVIYRVDILHFFIMRKDKTSIRMQTFSLSLSRCSGFHSLLNWYDSVKTPSTTSALIFCSLCSLLPPLVPAAEFLCIIYLSVFPAWLFLGLGSEGEIKQTPF